MGDEFTVGIRAQKQRLVTRARATVPFADTKPEAQVRYRGEDDKLNQTLAIIQRSLETVQGARGSRADHGVTYRALDSVFKEFEQKIQQGSTGLATTTNTANEALAYSQEAHTGEITSAAGSHSMQLDISAITNQTNVGADTQDTVVIHDNSDGALKEATIDSITDGGYF